MVVNEYARWTLIQEAEAILTRLARVKPFALHETMVPAAAIPPIAQLAIERQIARGRREVRDMVNGFLQWLGGPDGRRSAPSEAQRRFTLVRLRFNAALSQADVFSDVLTQRSEHETGVWLAGLDAVAADALAMPDYYAAPPVMCYLDRGIGAAIRRARTRLPGGGENPVAIIRVPRERMVGSGIASSLVHEVGHQATALLNLVASMQRALRERWQEEGGQERSSWRFWERWISEILADFWSVARIGVGSTLGLMSVVSVPRAFVFRVNLDDPHPIPWIRVKLSCGIGQALYPHPQWNGLAELWESFYPLAGLDKQRRSLLSALDASIPEFVHLLIRHRPSALKGKALAEALAVDQRQPSRLGATYDRWNVAPAGMRKASPTLAFAAIGQAKAEGKIRPEAESTLVSSLLTHWALRNALDPSAIRRGAVPAAVAASAV
jgi:hypothetical protein